jgi:hypothetical protein
MPALVAGIHVFPFVIASKTWMAGTSPAMTVEMTLDSKEIIFLLYVRPLHEGRLPEAS